MEKSKKSTLRRVFSIIIDVLLGLIIILGIVISVYSISSRSNGGLPSFFGKNVMTVKSESMTGTFDKGDIIIIDTFSNDDEEKAEEVQSLIIDESAVCFYYDLDGDGSNELVTHMYIGTTTVGSLTLYNFQGTYNPDNVTLDTQQIAFDQLVGVYTGQKVGGLGGILEFLRSPVGFGIFIVLPVFVFFMYTLIKLILTIMETRRAKKPAQVDISSMSDEEKAKLKAQLLKEMEENEKQSDGTDKEND